MKKKVFLAAAVALDTMPMATPAFAGNDGWGRDNCGWWHQFSNGSYARSSWVSANDSWYFMDTSGYMQTGWLNDRNGWYYLDTNNGNIYMGWVSVNGDWHYMNPADGGRMFANDYTPGSYYMNGNGMCRSGVGAAQSGKQDNNQSNGQNSIQLSEAQFEDQVIELVNQERTKQGTSPVKKDARLTSTADVCAVELEISFPHDRPDGSGCFTTYPRGFGYKGENITAGQRNPKEVMGSWMHSSGHRADILNSSYGSIGVGCSNLNGRANWVQNFGKRNSGQN